MSIYEQHLYGEGDDSKFRAAAKRYLEQAAEQKVRMQIEIRSSAKGTSTSQQESKFAVDPEDTTPDAIQHNVLERLNDSPGEGFTGIIRILFRESGSSDNKFGSFQCTIKKGYRPVPRYDEDEDEYDDDNDDEGGGGGGGHEIGNNAAELMALQRQAMAMRGMGGEGEPLHRTPAMIDARTLQEYMDVSMGFTFRALAQNAVMFQRATEIMEAMGLRFGVMPPDQINGSRAPQIPEQSGGGGDGGMGMGMLMTLLKGAMQLATADTPQQVVETATNLALGQEPDDSGVRKVAAKAGARAIQALERRGGEAPIQRRPHDGPAHDILDDDLDDFDDDLDNEPQGPTPMPSLEGKPPDEVKKLVVEWIRSDPNNKGAIMGMLPDLAKEIE